MSEHKPERRRYTRVFFSKHENLAGILRLSDNHEKLITATVKDLSEGGIGFAVKKDKKNKIIERSQLTIIKIQGSEQLGFINDLKLEVIWVFECDDLEHVGFGCKFLDTPQATREKIREYVEAWISGGVQFQACR